MVILWDLELGMEIQKIVRMFNGPISSATWVDIPRERAICFGCADGTIHVYRQLSEGVSIPIGFCSYCC
jgi:hypothetical protein